MFLRLFQKKDTVKLGMSSMASKSCLKFVIELFM